MIETFDSFAGALHAAGLIDDAEYERRLDRASRTNASDFPDEVLLDWVLACLQDGRFTRSRYKSWREQYLADHPEVDPETVPRITQIEYRFNGIRNTVKRAFERRDQLAAGAGERQAA